MVNLQQRASMLMAVAVLLAGIASVWAYLWLQSLETELRDEIRGTTRSQSVVVVNEDVSAGTAISAESVRLVSFPVEAVPEGVFDDMSRVSGRIAVLPFRRNEPVLETKLAPVEVTRGGIAALTGHDRRAIAVHVDEVIAVAGFIHPGDHVDVLATLHTDDDKSRPVTKMILENVLVLATGGNAADASKNASVGNAEGPTQDVNPREAEKSVGNAEAPHVMTLDVSPHEAEKLALAASEGKIHLVLRHPLNGEKIDTGGATVEGLLGHGRRESTSVPDRRAGNASTPRVATKEPDTASAGRHKAPSPASIVEVIRGFQRSEVKLANSPQSEPTDEHVR
jgi:pilus assembly protein CpaB